jgi:serine/threonine protein phosphatase PrpC
MYPAICTNNNFQALTSREDAYIISPQQNWLVVADGVGQWSLEGILSALNVTFNTNYNSPIKPLKCYLSNIFLFNSL